MIRWLLLIVYIVLLFLNRRKTLKVSWIVLAVAVGIGIIVWIISSISERRESSIEDNVAVEVSYNPTACEEWFPILVSIHNGTRRTITKINFDIWIYKPWFSSDINESYSNLDTDKIIYAWENYSLCWKTPKISDYSVEFAQLIYKINWKNITFEK